MRLSKFLHLPYYYNRLLDKKTKYLYRYKPTFAEKLEQNLRKNIRYRESVFEVLDRKYRTRFQKYPDYYIKFIDYKFKNIPKDTCYCYNNNICPYWRRGYDGFTHCDLLKKRELHYGEDYSKAVTVYKTFKEINKQEQPIALFDMVKICGIGEEIWD